MRWPDCAWSRLLACGLALGGCDPGTVVAMTEVPALVHDGGCGGLGVACSDNSGCCSGLCSAGACSSSYLCRAAGQNCTAGTECCSTACGSDGTCVALSGSCTVAGEPCATSTECCGGMCANPGTGSPICQRPTGCLPSGEVCQQAADCCSTQCGLDASSGVNRCTPAVGCLRFGELCSIGPSTNCCSTGAGGGGRQVCEATNLGVSRCSGSGGHAACFAVGAACNYGAECCSNVCVPDPSGVRVCAAGCSASGGVCTADQDCCDGVCVAGICQPNPFDCTALGGTCSQAATCCSGQCDATLSLCTPAG